MNQDNVGGASCIEEGRGCVEIGMGGKRNMVHLALEVFLDARFGQDLGGTREDLPSESSLDGVVANDDRVAVVIAPCVENIPTCDKKGQVESAYYCSWC